MREYAPGDRFRDINWKSSERIDTLITRISPDNQEKVTRIEAWFRNYGPPRASIGDLWLLDRAKARFAWFIRAVKEENASYVFHIRSAAGDWELKEQEQIDAFLEELAVLPFYPAQNKDALTHAEGTGELYVFSTACDAALSGFLSVQSRPVTLFLAQNPLQRDAVESEIFRLRDFAACGVIPPAGLWGGLLFRQKRRQLSVTGWRAIIDYAETRL
jgi:hypothetical protein